MGSQVACHLFEEKEGICSKAANATGVLLALWLASPSPLKQVSPMQLRQKAKRLQFSSLVGGPSPCYSPRITTSALGSGVSARKPVLQAPILSTRRIFSPRIMETQVELLTLASCYSSNRALRSRGNKLTAPHCPQFYIHLTLRISHSDSGESFGTLGPSSVRISSEAVSGTT